jgi:hypothetical protein
MDHFFSFCLAGVPPGGREGRVSVYVYGLILGLRADPQQAVDVGEDPLEETFFLKGSAASLANPLGEVVASPGDSLEGYGDGDFNFIQVGNIIDKGYWRWTGRG